MGGIVEFHAREMDKVLIVRAREAHEAHRVVEAQLRAKTLRFATEAKAIEIAAEGKMRPTRSCSLRAKATPVEQSASAAPKTAKG